MIKLAKYINSVGIVVGILGVLAAEFSGQDILLVKTALTTCVLIFMRLIMERNDDL